MPSLPLLLRKLETPRWIAVAAASAFTLLVGTAKELFLDDEYEWSDQTANAVGVTASAIFVFTLAL